jgi:hypothetical protein
VITWGKLAHGTNQDYKKPSFHVCITNDDYKKKQIFSVQGTNDDSKENKI